MNSPSAHRLHAPWSGRMKLVADAALSAVIALGLFAFLIGCRLTPDGANLTLTARPWALASAVMAVFCGRMGLLMWRETITPRLPCLASSSTRAFGAKRLPATLVQGPWLAPLLLAAALTLPFFTGRYWLDLGTLVLIYVMMGWGLNIVVGLAGLLDLGYVGFYAVGAYTTAILSTQYGFSFWACLPLAGLLAASFGICLGFPVLRLRGDYLAIVTMAFGEIIRVLVLNWSSLTGGPNGIGDIPRPTLFGLTFSTAGGPHSFAGFFGLHPQPIQRVIFLYYVILTLALATCFVTLRLRRLPLGRAWEALREDEIACRALGIDVTVTKLSAFAIGAMFAGLAGAFFATRASFVSPESFTFIESAIVLAIVVLGGMGSLLGTALAALVMIGGSELLRDFAQYRMLMFGLALVVVMVLRPRGLIAGRSPAIRLADHDQGMPR